MNKKSILATILLVLFIGIFFLKSFLPNLLFMVGKYYFEQKNYVKSSEFLSQCVRLDSDNTDYTYYYVQSLSKLPLTYNVQKELFNIAHSSNINRASLLASDILNNFRDRILSKVGDNYIEQVPLSQGILRWDLKKFPLKIYIDSTFSPSQEKAVKAALKHWEVRTEGMLKFDIVKNIEDANITFVPNKEDIGKDCKSSDKKCFYIEGQTKPLFNGSILKQMNIIIMLKNLKGEEISYQRMYRISLHELCHALGIMGHSDIKGDLMYMSSIDPSENYTSDIRYRDINTLRLLYILAPDITNTPIDKIRKTNVIYAPVILGMKHEINQSKIDEARRYVEKAPDVSLGWMNLAIAYSEAGDYQNAITNQEKALTLAYSNEEKYTIYFNSGVIYLKMEKYQEALDVLQKASQLDNSPEVRYLKAWSLYNLKRDPEAKEDLILLHNQDPANVDVAALLSTIYLDEHNISKSKQVIETLLKNNPEAKNDERIKDMNGFNLF